jgi:hypothetical protein
VEIQGVYLIAFQARQLHFIEGLCQTAHPLTAAGLREKTKETFQNVINLYLNLCSLLTHCLQAFISSLLLVKSVTPVNDTIQFIHTLTLNRKVIRLILLNGIGSLDVMLMI